MDNMETEQKTILEEDTRLDRVLKGVNVSYKEIKDLQAEMAILKDSLMTALSFQEERATIKQIEANAALEIKRAELAAAREQESHQWERSLPLCSESTIAIVQALAEIKSEGIEIEATGSNGRGESLDYDDMLRAFQRPLALHGINIHSSLIPGFDPKDDDILRTELRHAESGEFIASYSKVHISFVSQTMELLQKRSSAITYAKRHNLQALLGL
jgi:hypothetical protein